MLDSPPFSVDNVPYTDSPVAEKHHQWRTWAAREIQQRALLAYHILDGLIAQISGDGTTARHVANPLTLPSSEAVFNASTADEWLLLIRTQKAASQPSFRLVFRSLFPPATSSFRALNYQFSAFGLRVVLEGLQSLVSDSDESDLASVGVPDRSDVRCALVHVHEAISSCAHISTAERLEILLRWHTICLDTMINSTALCRYLCARYSMAQFVCGSGGSRTLKDGFDVAKWVRTEDARRALLHAIAIQDIIEQLPRGRAHVIHMPGSLFAAATVYFGFCVAGVPAVRLPTVIWDEAVESSHSVEMSETARFVQTGRAGGQGAAVRNMLYELNSMQKLFRCLCSQWGIAFDMEEVVDRWIALSLAGGC